MFKFDHVSDTRTFIEKVRYCDDNFNRLAVGSSRRVYDLEDGRALKLAINNKGLAQNAIESDYGRAMMYPDLINPTIDSSPNSSWTLTKKMDSVDRKEIAESFGVPWIKMSYYFDALNRFVLTRGCYNEPETPRAKSFEHQERLKQFHDMVVRFDILASEFHDPNAFGRDPDTGKILIVDCGCTRDVYLEHYRKSDDQYGLAI